VQIPGIVPASLCRQPKVRVIVGQVIIEVGLAYPRVGTSNVVDKRAEVDTVQALNWIIEDDIEYVIDGSSNLVASDGADKAVSSPRFARGGVLCPEFLALMGRGAGR
jgi:hypothetical protein